MTLDEWLTDYSDSHQHPINKLIHWICVPTIMFCILGMLWAVWEPAAVLLIAAATLFYLRLSPRLYVGMVFVVLAMAYIGYGLGDYLFNTCLALFLIAWVFQFIGHLIEGAKPSFFKDLQFLFIGPLWILAHVYQKLGLRIA